MLDVGLVLTAILMQQQYQQSQQKPCTIAGVPCERFKTDDRFIVSQGELGPNWMESPPEPSTGLQILSTDEGLLFRCPSGAIVTVQGAYIGENSFQGGTISCTSYEDAVAQAKELMAPEDRDELDEFLQEVAAEAPKPTWVPDPSAGHWDCPDGFTAYAAIEPPTYSNSILQSVPAVYTMPTLDAKGHVLAGRPAQAPKCLPDGQ